MANGSDAERSGVGDAKPAALAANGSGAPAAPAAGPPVSPPPIQEAVSKPGRTSRSGVTATVLGVLLSLIIKSALDHTFESVSHYHSLGQIWEAFLNAPTSKILALLQLLVFLFTVVRFYVGAYRYAESTSGGGIPEAIATVVGTFLLFAGFYIASLALRN